MESQEEIEKTFNDFFFDLLEEPQEDRDRAMEVITSNIPAIVSQDKNDLLMRKVDMEELEEAIH